MTSTKTHTQPPINAAGTDLKFLVTGTGRCGTGYIARLLTESGLLCTHEKVFGPRGIEKPSRKPLGDSSWLAAPYLNNFPGPIIHIVRHPLAVLNSLYGTGLFSGVGVQPYTGFANSYLSHETANIEEPILKSCMFMVEWIDMITKHATHTWRVEGLDVGTVVGFSRALGGGPLVSGERVLAALSSIPTNVNTRHRGSLTLDKLPGLVQKYLRDLCDQFAYAI